MRKLLALLFLTIIVNINGYANAQSIPPLSSLTTNNATVNIIGNFQNVTINQLSGSGHSVNLNLIGNNIPVNVTQSGLTPQSFSLSVTCFVDCALSPYVVNQY